MTMNVVVHMVAGAAAVAAAWIGIRRVAMHLTLDEQYALIRDATSKLSATSERPATMVVAGLQGHGKSSFIDTLFRVLYREDGRPLITRALAIPPSSPSARHPQRFIVKNYLTRYPKRLLHVIDLPGPDLLDYDAALSATDSTEDEEWRPECVVLVMRTDECATSGAAWEQLPALVRSVRQQGLPLLVLMTHKRDAKNAGLNLKEVAKDVASRAGTDLVYCIDNYVAASAGGGSSSNGGGGARVRMDMDTHCQTLSIVQQCLEFARQRRFNHLAVSAVKQPRPRPLAAPEVAEATEATNAPMPDQTPAPPVVAGRDTTRVKSASSRRSMAAPAQIPECTPPASAPARAATKRVKSASRSSSVPAALAGTSDPAAAAPPAGAVTSDPAAPPPLPPVVTAPALAVTSDPAPPPPLPSLTSNLALAPPPAVTSDPSPMEEEISPAVVPAEAPMTTTPEQEQEQEHLPAPVDDGVAAGEEATEDSAPDSAMPASSSSSFSTAEKEAPLVAT